MSRGCPPFRGIMLIQVDTTAQGYEYKSEIILINKFDVFAEIRVAPLDILLSQKIYTAVNRKRPKGRDCELIKKNHPR
jgi:hypothetical protein